MTRAAYIKYANVSPSPTSVVFNVPGLAFLTVTSTQSEPIYFRVDGETAAVEADGNFQVTGYGGVIQISLDEDDESVTVSLVSDGTGVACLIAENGV